MRDILILEPSYTFDDVLLKPGYSEVLPGEVDVRSFFGAIPIISAAMDTVTESRLAIAMAHEGGLGVIHKSMSISQQVEEVLKVKNYEHGMVKQPFVVNPDQEIGKVSSIANAKGFSGMPVVDAGKLVGIITNRDMRSAENANIKVASCMTPKEKLVTVNEGESVSQVVNLMHKYRVEKVLVVNDSFELVGMYTLKDILQSQKKPKANKDSRGQLRVAAAVGVGADSKERSEHLVNANVDIIVIDTAHGHTKSVLEHVKWLRQKFSGQIVAGNIATAVAAKALADVGADILKVGIGPGSICTTRVIAGIGVPQITAINDVATAIMGSEVKIIADGGIRYSGDIVKALAAGADAVMLGGALAGTDEAPGSVELYQGRAYKSYRGMGSVAAMTGSYGSKDRYFQTESAVDKLVPEGVEGRVAYKGPLSNVINQFVGGLKAGMGYCGAKNISELKEKAVFCKITAAGYKESHVHDVQVTKEAPNYSRED